MPFRKILKVASRAVGYILAISLGIILSTSAGKAASSNLSNIVLAIALMAVLAHLSLGLFYFSLKASPKRVVRALLLVLSGIVIAYLLDNLLSSGDFTKKRMIASGLYALFLLLIFISLRKIERVSAPINLLQITTQSVVIYFIVFFEYQYGLFLKADQELDSAIAYERHFSEKGKCFPTLAKKNPEVLRQYVAELKREEQKANRHLPDTITDSKLYTTISQIAARHNVAIEDYTVSRTMKEFYTQVDIALAVKGQPVDMDNFTDAIANDDMIINWIRKPGDTQKELHSDKFNHNHNAILTTYTYIDYEGASYKGSSRTCSFTPQHHPIRLLFPQLDNKQATYRKLCNEKWAHKAYTEMMLYAEKTKLRLIEKGHIAAVLQKKTTPRQMKFNLNMPVCPLSRHTMDE